jgi:hypothetical protein
MGTIHEAYLNLKEELGQTQTIHSHSTYINKNFKEVLWQVTFL